MRWSKTFIPTLKEVPSEAEIISHQLLLRAGLVRKLTGGLYTFLPTGLRVLRKISQIVREEMDQAGGLEVLMPALQPPDIWKQSGRYEAASDVLFTVQDRARKEWVLGPTHEEVITHLVASEIGSYRQLPKNFYQIQTKFRDEIRPRFGLMRAKEFIMKDAYSFDATDEGAQESYFRMYGAYEKIFKRCGLKAIAVEADTGVMGGKFSHEFMVPAPTGENDVVYDPEGKYAANVEKAISRGSLVPLFEGNPQAVLEKFPTPGVVTIEALEKPPFGIPANRQIKTLVFMADERVVLVLIRGDDHLNEAKLTGFLGVAALRPAQADEIVKALGAHPGSLGAVSVKGIQILADSGLKGLHDGVTGANEDGFHWKGVSLERDISVSEWGDFRTVQEGELDVESGRPLRIQRAIEVGHVFKLGTKYSQALGAVFLDENGQRQPAIMGCYGIGVTRTLQAVIEQSHDGSGIIWPEAIAPFRVCITPLDCAPEGRVMKLAEEIYSQLSQDGHDVLLDDRDERPGVKFKDSELIGIPWRLSLGEKSLAKGVVEWKSRTGERVDLPLESALETIQAALQGA